jgi:hypothetical protein
VTRWTRLPRVSNGSTTGTTFEVCVMARCDTDESFDVAERYHLSLPSGSYVITTCTHFTKSGTVIPSRTSWAQGPVASPR